MAFVTVCGLCLFGFRMGVISSNRSAALMGRKKDTKLSIPVRGVAWLLIGPTKRRQISTRKCWIKPRRMRLPLLRHKEVMTFESNKAVQLFNLRIAYRMGALKVPPCGYEQCLRGHREDQFDIPMSEAWTAKKRRKHF